MTDLDPQEVPTDSPEDNSASESVTEFGIDVEAPLLERQDMSVIAYADWAKISGKGSGSFIGSTSRVRPRCGEDMSGEGAIGRFLPRFVA